ncbi:MAG: hypothetical protein AB8H12_12395 [Lewinella sp.]
MSNTFNDELQQAIKGVYTELGAQEMERGGIEKAAKLGVYYAHGATDKASKKVKSDQEKAQNMAVELAETTKTTEICGNIVTAATTAATDARNTNSAASTAAVNIQAAANALTELSADIAAILALATAKDNGRKIQELAKKAYDITSSVAEKAENTTLQALNTTIEAAQSKAAVSLNQAKILHTDIQQLNKVLGTNFKAIQARISDDADVLTAAIATENEHKGNYKTALEEEKAMLFSEAFINRKVNADLKYIKVGTLGEQFKVSFRPFDTVKEVLRNGVFKEENVLKEYRIIFTSVDDAPAFDIHAAKATLHYFPFLPETSLIPTDPATVLEAHEPAPYVIPFSLADRGPKAKQIAVDHSGQTLRRGTPYVVFVYVAYTSSYQNEMESTYGYLSLPSLPFTLKTDLPDAHKPRLRFYQNRTEVGNNSVISNAMRVTFTVDKLMYRKVDISQLTDFRVFLFRKEDQVAAAINHLIEDQFNVLFQNDEEYRVAEQAYLIAEQAYKTALATNSNTAAAEKALDAAQQEYEQKKLNYNAQQRAIEVLNQAKTSNFLPDRDILNSIPVAFGINAKIEKKATEGSAHKFVAINEHGDFTDNYGESLMTGQKYAALVLSVIKTSEPEAIPLFNTSFSVFSDDVTYDLPQL